MQDLSGKPYPPAIPLLQTKIRRRQKSPTQLLPRRKPWNPLELHRSFKTPLPLPFSKRIRKPVADEQFGKFIEVIRKLYVNVPLLDAMQVPTLVTREACPPPRSCNSQRSVAQLYSIISWRRRKIQDAPQSHAQSGVNISHTLYVIWEQASASCPR